MEITISIRAASMEELPKAIEKLREIEKKYPCTIKSAEVIIGATDLIPSKVIEPSLRSAEKEQEIDEIKTKLKNYGMPTTWDELLEVMERIKEDPIRASHHHGYGMIKAIFQLAEISQQAKEQRIQSEDQRK